ncbi:MAG: FadR family transcriptional regulator, partial [Scardovia wiggsiae]|nr:FadR family transcriptional regulator [Scardovia wiggsiae]
AASHNNMLQAAIAGDVDAYRDAVVEHYKPIEGILNSYLG